MREYTLLKLRKITGTTRNREGDVQVGTNNRLHTKSQYELDGEHYYYHRLRSLNKNGEVNITRLPFSICVLLESILRHYDDYETKQEHIPKLSQRGKQQNGSEASVPFKRA